MILVLQACVLKSTPQSCCRKTVNLWGW